MQQKIRVLVDTYFNPFSRNSEYGYSNVRAVNPSEQDMVDKCVQEMKNENNDLFILDTLHLYAGSPGCPPNKIGKSKFLLDKDRECFFNISQKRFEFG